MQRLLIEDLIQFWLDKINLIRSLFIYVRSTEYGHQSFNSLYYNWPTCLGK